MNPARPHIDTEPPQNLICHPAAPCPLPLRIETSVTCVASSSRPGLLLRYALYGPITELSIPPRRSGGHADGLWQHTCFEAFIGQAQSSAYREFNFSPSGQWAVYRFSDERIRDSRNDASNQEVGAPQLRTVLSTPDALVLEAWLPPQLLPQSAAGESWRIGLSAVIETRHSQFSYWALHHPGEKPDFHKADGHALRLLLPPPTLPNAPEPTP